MQLYLTKDFFSLNLFEIFAKNKKYLYLNYYRPVFFYIENNLAKYYFF